MKITKKRLTNRLEGFFATNTPFNHVEHAELKLCNILRPGYVPATRKCLGNDILDSVHESEKAKCKELLRGKTVSMCLDGWSNVHNCSSVVLPSGEVFLVDTVDTSGHSHTAEYLSEVAVNAIDKCKNDTGVWLFEKCCHRQCS